MHWKDWFNSRDSVNLINKSHQEQLFKAFNHSIPDETIKFKIQNHDETVFMFRQNFGNSKVGLFHHMKIVGGNLYSEEEEVGCIQGIQEPCLITQDLEALTSIPNETSLQVPTLTNLFAVSNKEELKDVQTGSSCYMPRNFIPVPPFLLNTISDAILNSNGELSEVFLKSIEKIKEFDTIHAEDNDYHDKAKSKCKDLLFWLYLAGQDKVSKIPSMICTSRPVIEYFKKNVNTKLSNHQNDNPSTDLLNALKRPMEIIALNTSINSDNLTKLSQIQSQNLDKSSKSFSKIAPRYQNMLLIASSLGQAVPPTLNKEAIEFFSQSSVLHAQIYLNSYLENSKIEVSVSSAVTTSLQHGSFLWTNPLTPSGFASSVLTSVGLLKPDVLQEGIVLDYSTKFEMSAASLEKLTKTKIMYPSDLESTIERIRAFHTLTSLFFGEKSYPEQGLQKLLIQIQSNKDLMRREIYFDELFIPKFLYVCDDKMHQWLKQCCSAKSILDTNIELLNFSQIFSDIQHNRFFCNLPSSITKLSPSEENTRKKRKQETEKIVNPKVNPKWKLRPNESWDAVFRFKSKEGPMLSTGCQPCLKYLAKGFCYPDCHFKAAHCTPVGEDEKKIDNFIKGLRGE